jgi:NADH-quinone oxidoreductase subunit K
VIPDHREKREKMTLTITQIAWLAIAGLLAAGFYGLLISRNLIKIVIALQIMVKAALLALVSAGHASGQVSLGQSIALTVIVADTVVAVIGLALAVQIRRRAGTLDIHHLTELRG